MTHSRIALAALLLLLMPLAQAGSAPSDPEPAIGDLKLEFHPLRPGNAPKIAGNSLKPELGKPEYLPVDVALHMHVREDGSTSFTCDEDHRQVKAATDTERTP